MVNKGFGKMEIKNSTKARFALQINKFCWAGVWFLKFGIKF
jgi:hypothetical protein